MAKDLDSERRGEVVLSDGASVVIRNARPSDKELFLELFEHLGPTSRRYRFFCTRKTFTERELAALTEPDPRHRATLVAAVREKGTEHAAGMGLFVVTSPDPVPGQEPVGPKRAEVAFAVADEHQGRGIGTLLLEQLAEIAREQGIEEFEADVLGDNAQMLKVFGESGFTITESFAEGVAHVVFPTGQTDELAAATLERERQARRHSVRVFFEPTSVAVVGASRREGTIGRALLDNLRNCGFRGPIYPVNPGVTEIDGLPTFASVGSIGQPVDLVIVCVPAAAVEAVVADCAAAHAKGIVVISSGFAEVSPEGRIAEQRLRHLVRSSGMRLVGPNCMGVLNATRAVSLNATFAPTWPPEGNVSMLSQSGALGIAMLDYAAKLNVGLAGFVSVGNKADISGNDLLSYWGDDPHTGVIVLYLESFGNARKFARLAPAVARRKPIVAVKSGRSAAGTRAASSHSAALASLDVGIDALFAQAGVIRTNTLEELFDVVALLSTQPLPRGPRVGVVTNAGGPGILLADACEARGLTLPSLAPETLARLREILPPQAGLSNPVDMIASATAEQYEQTIGLVGRDPNVDSVVTIYIPPLVTNPEEIAAAIARGAAFVPPEKPLATVFLSSKGAPPMLSQGPRGKIPSYSFPENAAMALATAQGYARWRERPRGTVRTIDPATRKKIRAIVERNHRASPGESRWLPSGDLAELLGLVGVFFAESVTVSPDPEDAARASATFGGNPVVMKAIAPGLVHKTDVGGVTLGLTSPQAVRAAAIATKERLRQAGYELEGLLLQRQIDGGVEAIVGVTTDPSLGPLVVAGLGGIQVELLRDVAFRLTPVSDTDARDMIEGLRAKKLLDGFRGAPEADKDALIDVILGVSALVEIVPELLELDLNPIKVLARGEGAIVVDGRARVR